MSEPASLSSPPQPEDKQSLAAAFLSIERPKSASDEQLKEHHEAWYPRRLSFSIAQDAIETWYISSIFISRRQYPFQIETDRLEGELDVINKWAEDQLDLVEVIYLI
jgi:hypothetical protein